MPEAFTRLSNWLCGRKDNQNPKTKPNSTSDFPSGYREPDSLKFPSSNPPKIGSSARRSRSRRRSREERKTIDKEFDVVLVPSDGSRSSSSGSDWSIGWLEPHGSGFQSDTANGFAVLVPCYGRGRCEKVEVVKNGALGAVQHKINFSYDRKDYVEQWLSSLRNK